MVDIEKDMKDVVAGRPIRPIVPTTPVTPLPNISPSVTDALAVTSGKRVQPEAYDRVKEHGDYAATAAWTQTIKDWMRNTPNWDKLPPGKKQSLEMNAVKIARILHGDPNFADHWEDIAGYALLGLRS